MDSLMKELRGGGTMPPRIFGLEPPLFRRLISEVPRPIAIKLSNMLGSECHLRS